MKFYFELTDRNGTVLNDGDIVRVSDSHGFTFYSEVKYFPETNIIVPFHTFSFHSFEKVDSIPDNALPGKADSNYKIWYVPNAEKDDESEKFDRYHSDWMSCDRLLEGRCYVIKRVELGDNQLKLDL